MKAGMKMGCVFHKRGYGLGAWELMTQRWPDMLSRCDCVAMVAPLFWSEKDF